MIKRVSVISLVVFLIVISCFTSCVNDKESTRDRISLSKDWLEKSEGGKIFLSHQVRIPDNWNDKYVSFDFKYPDSISVLVDGEMVMKKSKSVLPYALDLSDFLKVGKHNITLVTDSTFKNKDLFSGILEEADKTHIDEINIIHNDNKKNVLFNLRIANPILGENVKVSLYVIKRISDIRVVLDEKIVTVPYSENIKIPYDLKNNYHCWNEENIPSYSAFVSISSANVSDNKKVFFGIKDIKVDENKILLDDKPFRPLFVKLSKSDLNENKIKEVKNKGFNTLLFDNYIPSSKEFEIIDNGLLLFGLETHDDLSLKEHSRIIDICKYHAAFSFYILDNISTDKLDSLKLKYPDIIFSLNKKSYFSFNNETGYISGDKNNSDELFYNISSYKPYIGENSDFKEASNNLSFLCYKNELEKALLSNKYLGYIFDNDNISTSDLNLDKRASIFLDLKSYNFRKSQVLKSNIYFSGKSLSNDTLQWQIINKNSKILRDSSIVLGENINGLNKCGEIYFDLDPYERAQTFKIKLFIKNSKIDNNYEINVYPGNGYKKNENIYVSRVLNKSVINSAERGYNILLMPNVYAMYKKTFFTNFSSFMGKDKTKGLYIQKNHPIFKDFPTNSFTSWQWKSILEGGRAVKLDSVSSDYKPIVSVIDNSSRNYNLAWICEFKMGKGKILICMTNLYNLSRSAEAIQLYNSIIDYMNSASFRPTEEVSEGELKKMLNYTYTK